MWISLPLFLLTELHFSAGRTHGWIFSVLKKPGLLARHYIPLRLNTIGKVCKPQKQAARAAIDACCSVGISSVNIPETPLEIF
jgi:hypothetical protein